MIESLLYEMFIKNIELIIQNGKTKILYKEGVLDEILKERIKENKKTLLKRISENEAAKEKGFLIYNFGQLYEYRYGQGAFLFIERVSSYRATAWRENFLPGSQKAYKTKIIVQNVPFKVAFEEANSFIDWLNKKSN